MIELNKNVNGIEINKIYNNNKKFIVSGLKFKVLKLKVTRATLIHKP